MARPNGGPVPASPDAPLAPTLFLNGKAVATDPDLPRPRMINLDVGAEQEARSSPPVHVDTTLEVSGPPPCQV